MREFYTVSAARFRNADRPACAPDRPGVRDISGAFPVATGHPRRLRHRRPRSSFSPAKRSGETRFAMASGPQGTKRRHASSPFNRISIRCVRKIADPEAPRTQETKDLPDPEFSPRAGKRSGSAPDRKAGRTTGSRRARKARAASVLSARPVTSAVSSHSENNAGRIPRPARMVDRHQIELRIRIEAVERDIMLGGPHQRRELAGRHRLLGRRERAAPGGT